MPFFKDLKRRSRASFHQDSSSNNSSNESGGSHTSNSTVPTTKSSSTLNSFVDVPQAAALKPSLQRSLSNLTRSKTRASNTSVPAIPERPPPQPISAQGKRYSMLVRIVPSQAALAITDYFRVAGLHQRVHDTIAQGPAVFLRSASPLGIGEFMGRTLYI